MWCVAAARAWTHHAPSNFALEERHQLATRNSQLACWHPCDQCFGDQYLDVPVLLESWSPGLLAVSCRGRARTLADD